MFMVAGIYFMKELLLFTFTKIILSVRSKMILSFLFSLGRGNFVAAFLDAPVAVIITVAYGLWRLPQSCIRKNVRARTQHP